MSKQATGFNQPEIDIDVLMGRKPIPTSNTQPQAPMAQNGGNSAIDMDVLMGHKPIPTAGDQPEPSESSEAGEIPNNPDAAFDVFLGPKVDLSPEAIRERSESSTSPFAKGIRDAVGSVQAQGGYNPASLLEKTVSDGVRKLVSQPLNEKITEAARSIMTDPLWGLSDHDYKLNADNLDTYLKTEEEREAFEEALRERYGDSYASVSDLSTISRPMESGEEILRSVVFTRNGNNIEIPIGLAEDWVAQHNAEVKHNEDFREDPEYRNQWFLSNLGISEQTYRNEVAADLENRLKELRKKVVATLPAQHTRGGYTAIGAAANKPSSDAPVSIEKIDKALKVVNTLRKNNFGAGLKEGFDLADILTLGVSGIGENVALLNAFNKSASGKKLTTSEQALVEAWDIQNEAEEVIDTLGGRKRGANVGAGVSQALGFMTQTAGTGGIASLATKGIGRAAARTALLRATNMGVNKSIKEGLRYGGLKVAESAVGAAARTPFMGFTYQNYTDKRLNQFQVKERVDEATGEISKYIDKQEASALRDAAHAVLESYFENQSEDVGGLIDFGITSFARALPLKGLLRNRAAEALRGPVKNGAMKWIKEGIKLHSIIGETLSEAYGDAMVNLLTANNEGWKRMATSEYWWELGQVSSILSGGFWVANQGVNALAYKDERKAINKNLEQRKKALSRIEDDNLKKELTQATLTDDVIDRSKRLSSLNWSNFSREDMANAVDFIDAQTRLDVMREGATESRRLARIMPAIDEVKKLADGGALDDEQAAASLATIYSDLFRTQENQRALNIITDRIKVAADAGISADKINDILRGAGLTVFNPGDEIETLTGDRAIVDKVLPGAYEIVNDEGVRAVVSFEEVLQNAPEIRQIQQESQQPVTQSESAPEINPQVEQAVEVARQEAAEIINKDDNTVYEVETDDGITGYIIGGKGIVVDNDGRITQSTEDTVAIKTDEGNKVVHKERVKVKSRQTLQEIEDLARGAAEGALAAVQPQQPVGGKIYQGIYDNEPVTINLPSEIKFNADGTVDYDNLMNPETVSVIRPNGAVVDEVGLNEIEQLTEAQPEAEQVSVDAPAVEHREVTNLEPDFSAIRPVSIGDFGPIYDQFRGNAKDAIALLLQRKDGEAVGALSHPEVGEIDLVWGYEGTSKSDGYGLSKLAKYHPEVLENLQEILNDMKVASRTENRVQLESDTHKASVRLTWNEQKKNWLLTAFEKKEASASIGKTTDTDDNPKDLRGDTALSQNTDALSDDKYTTSEPKNQEVAQKNVAETTSVVQQPQIPTQKNGKPDYNAMDAQMFVEQYVSRFGEERTEKLARNNIKVADKAIDTLEKQIDGATDPNKIPALYEKQQTAKVTRDKYAAVLDILGLSVDENEDNAARVQRKKQENTSWFNKLFPDGFPNVESVILWDIANGNRIRWANKEVNGAVVSKGLGSELGLADSNAERTRRIALIGKDAPTPEEYAEQLPERLKAMGVRFEEGELRDKVLDVYASVDTVRKAKEELEKISANIQSEQEGLDYEEEQMRRNYEREQEALRQETQTEVGAEQTEQEQLTNEETQEEELSIEDEVPFMVSSDSVQATTEAQKLATEAAITALEDAGVEVVQATPEMAEEALQQRDVQLQAVEDRLIALKKAENFVVESLQGKRRNKSFRLTLPYSTLSKIRASIGRDFDSHNLDGNSFVHSKRLHGINGEKIDANSIPLSDKDFALAPYIMVAPDRVAKGSVDAIGRESIRFEKTLSNGVVVVVEKEQKNSPSDMDTITMWADLSGSVMHGHSPASTIVRDVIATMDNAKIRKDAENAIRQDVQMHIEQQNSIDAAYMEAVNAGNMDRAKALVREYAESRGYYLFGEFRDAHAAPSSTVDKPDFTNANLINEKSLDEGWDVNLYSIPQGENLAPNDFWSPMGPRWYMYNNKAGMETHAAIVTAIRSIQYQINFYGEVRDIPSVKVYRAVPNSVVVDSLENGDWVTPSLTYANAHGLARFGEGEYRIIEQEVPATDLWWDGNDAREWGYDNGNVEAYANTPNHIKLLAPITYDDAGNIIPLSARFDPTIADSRFSIGPAPVFVSNAKIAVLGIKQEKATPEQWLKMIEKAGGLKAGEDKWIGLSDWLKASDKKTLTKQEVLDYINENQIQIEETTYSSNNVVETTPEFKALQEEFKQIAKGYEDEARRNLDEYEAKLAKKYNLPENYFDTTVLNSDESKAHSSLSRAVYEAYNAAWVDLVDKYGDDFEIAFRRGYDGIRVYNAEAAGILLGLPIDRPIYYLREDYTTKGLEGNREIALTVPTIEPWNEDDEIHFGDAGDGRAIAWVRFGETTALTDDAIAAKKAVEDYLTSMREKYGSKEGEETDAMTAGEIDHLQSLTAKEIESRENGLRVLVIDEIQSKRHQEGREKGYRAKKQSFNVQEAEQNLRSVVKELNDYRDQLKRKYDYDSLGGSAVERVTHFTNGLSAEERNELRRLNERKSNLEIMLQAHRDVRIGIDDITFTEHDGVIDASYGDYISTFVTGTTPAMMLQTLREMIRQDRIDNARRFDKLIPEAPFEKNWAELAMKRMLRYAAENGFDKVAWTKGDQQNERYGLGSIVQRITSYEDGGNRMVIIRLSNNEPLNLKVDSEGKIVSSNREIGANMLSDVVGKELAVKIMNNEGEDATYYDGRDIPAKVIAGDGLRIGGEGMKGFYDDMLPRFMNKYGKKWGVKVQDVTLPFVEVAGRTMHSVDVTESMRESVMQGQPMFYRRPNGTVYGWTNGTTVYLTESGMNPNTPIHEYTHVWADAMRKHNPEGWASIVKLLKGTPVWNEVMADANYASIHNNENQVASEALSRISGRENSAKMEAMAQLMIDENANDTVKKHRARKLLDKMRKALQEFWSWVGKELFGIKNFESIEQVTDRILYDLVSGTDLNPVSSFDTSAAERAEIIRAAKANGTYLKAPNGKDTNLTPEQWVTVRTRAFKGWFGDWENDPENASKVVDENGEPKVVYHQTNAKVYINRKTGQNWDELDWRERMEWDERDDWDDYWIEQDFTKFSRVNARVTQEFDGFFFAPEYDEYHEYGDRTIVAFLNIRKPASREDYNIDSTQNNAGREERLRLQSEGFDGVIREYAGAIDEYIAFYPNQIKLAEGNTTFDPDNDDVRFSIGRSEDRNGGFSFIEHKVTPLARLEAARDMLLENRENNPNFEQEYAAIEERIREERETDRVALTIVDGLESEAHRVAVEDALFDYVRENELFASQMYVVNNYDSFIEKIKELFPRADISSLDPNVRAIYRDGMIVIRADAIDTRVTGIAKLMHEYTHALTVEELNDKSYYRRMLQIAKQVGAPYMVARLAEYEDLGIGNSDSGLVNGLMELLARDMEFVVRNGRLDDFLASEDVSDVVLREYFEKYDVPQPLTELLIEIATEIKSIKYGRIDQRIYRATQSSLLRTSRGNDGANLSSDARDYEGGGVFRRSRTHESTEGSSADSGGEVGEGSRGYRADLANSQEQSASDQENKLTPQEDKAKDKTLKQLDRLNKVINSLRQTVKQAERDNVDLANIVQAALEEEVKDGGINRFLDVPELISLIRSGMDKKSIESTMDRLSERLTDAIIKNREEQLAKLLQVQVQGTNAFGIPIGYAVDDETRAMVEFFRENLSRDMKKIVETMENADEKFLQPYNKSELNVWFTAYKEIEESRYNIKATQKDIDHETERSQSFYRLTKELKAKNASESQIKTAQEHRRQALRNKKAQKKAILVAKQTLAQELEGMIFLLGGRLRDGRAIRAGRLSADKVYAKNFLTEAMADVRVNDGTKTYQGTKEQLEAKAKFHKDIRVRTSAYRSYAYMIQSISRNAIGGKGFLWDALMEGKNGWVDCNDKRLAMDNIDNQEILANVQASGLKSVADLQRLFDKQLVDKNGNPYIFRYETARTGRIDQDIRPTIGWATYIVLCFEQDDMAPTMEKMRITEEQVQQIRDMLPEAAKEFLKWSREMLSDRRQRIYNPASLERFGTQMANIPNYFPIRRLEKNLHKVEEVEQVASADSDQVTITANALIKRVRNVVEIDFQQNPLELLKKHLERMNGFAANVPLARNVNILLNSSGFRDQLNEQGDPNTYEYFKAAAKVALSSYKPKPAALDSVMIELQGWLAAGKIAWRFFTALKQLLSIPAFWTYNISPRYKAIFIRSVLWPAVKNGDEGKLVAIWKWGMDNIPQLRERWSSRYAGNEKLAQVKETLTAQFIAKHALLRKTVGRIGEWGMIPNAAVDLFACSIGCYAVYTFELEQLQKKGYSKEEADELAKRRASIAFNESQQSSEAAFIAPLQRDRTFLAVQVSLFNNSNFGYGRKEKLARKYLWQQTFNKDLREKRLALAKRRYLERFLNEERNRLVENNNKIADVDQRLRPEEIDRMVESKRAEFSKRAEKEANRDAKMTYAKGIEDVVMFKWLLNMAWQMAPTAVTYWLSCAIRPGDDEDPENPLSAETLALMFATATFRNAIGGGVLESALNGYGFTGLVGSEVEKTVDILAQALQPLWLTDEEAESFDPLAVWMAVKQCLVMGTGFDVNVYANIFTGLVGLFNDRSRTTADVLRILNAPKSMIREIEIIPFEDETLDNYIRRMAMMENVALDRMEELKGIPSSELNASELKVLRKMKKWEKNLITTRQAEAADVPYDREVDGRVVAPRLKQLDADYTDLLKSLDLTQSGKNRAGKVEFTEDERRRKKALRVVTRVKGIHNMEESAIEVINNPEAYKKEYRQIVEEKRKLIEDWNK